MLAKHRPPDRTPKEMLAYAKREVLRRAFQDYNACAEHAGFFELARTRYNLHEAVSQLKLLDWTP